MGMRKVLSSVLLGVIIAGSIGILASAVEVKQEVLTDRVIEMEITRATGSFTDGYWPIRRIGISATYGKGYAELINDKEWQSDLETRNILLSKRLRANYRAGYWEMICLHTKPLDVVPKDMRAK